MNETQLSARVFTLAPLAGEAVVLPDWMRSAVVTEDNEIWVPAALGGDEAQVAIAALQAGEMVGEEAEHPFVRLAWIKAHYPGARLFDQVEARVRAWLAEDTTEDPA